MLPGLQVALQDYPCCRLVNTAHCQCSLDCRLHYRTIHVADWLTLHIVNAPRIAGCITGQSIFIFLLSTLFKWLPGVFGSFWLECPVETCTDNKCSVCHGSWQGCVMTLDVSEDVYLMDFVISKSLVHKRLDLMSGNHSKTQNQLKFWQ